MSAAQAAPGGGEPDKLDKAHGHRVSEGQAKHTGTPSFIVLSSPAPMDARNAFLVALEVDNVAMMSNVSV